MLRNGAPLVRRQIEQWQLVPRTARHRLRRGPRRKNIHPSTSAPPSKVYPLKEQQMPPSVSDPDGHRIVAAMHGPVATRR